MAVGNRKEKHPAALITLSDLPFLSDLCADNAEHEDDEQVEEWDEKHSQEEGNEDGDLSPLGHFRPLATRRNT